MPGVGSCYGSRPSPRTASSFMAPAVIRSRNATGPRSIDLPIWMRLLASREVPLFKVQRGASSQDRQDAGAKLDEVNKKSATQGGANHNKMR